MITEFYLDPCSFESKLLNDESNSATHDILIEYWQKYGILITNTSSLEEYLSAIKNLPARFQQRWIRALADQPHIVSIEPWETLAKYETFDEAKALSRLFKTGITEETTCVVICNSEQSKKYCEETKFEIIGASTITESSNFNKSKEFSTKDIQYGSDINEIWSDRFASTAKHIKNITISDRYIFERILDDISKGHQKTSIANFINLLPNNKKHSITIISDGSTKDSQTNTEIANYFEFKLLKNANIAKKISAITLISMSQENFQKHAHDRYIRFDRLVFQIGVGMSIFETRKMQATTFTAKQKFESTANEIEKIALTPSWRVTLRT